MNPQAAALLGSLAPWSAAPGDAWARLRGLLEKQADSAFGRYHGFDSIRSPEDFREAIPAMDYEAHRSWIERCAGGEKRVLACEEPIGFERTSGTSSRAKWIPVTPGLQEEFARGLATWFGGWERRCPEVFAGRAYWAISPPGMIPEKASGGLPVGMTSDAAYFPDDVGGRLAEWLVMPGLSGEPESVFEETAEALLGTPDLSVVSVWSPTFLLGIDAVVRRLTGGRTWQEIWPKLALVSCWADASSAPWIPKLGERLGEVPIEAKGLLATEGITSIPDALDGSPRLATECHWHEFLDNHGRFTAIADLKSGGIYEVLFTTSGGLFRYRSGDRVQVTGMKSDGPRLRFVGRDGSVSDLAGEKLHEDQVVEALAGRGFLVADPERPGYDLWLVDVSPAAEIEGLLRRNPYFDQALALRQLSPLMVREAPDDWCLRLTGALARRRGCRLGDVKPPVLLTRESAAEVASWLS